MLINFGNIALAAEMIENMTANLSLLSTLTEKELGILMKNLPDSIEHETYQQLVNFATLILDGHEPEKREEVTVSENIESEEFPRIIPDATGDEDEETDDDWYNNEGEELGNRHRRKPCGKIPENVKNFIYEKLELGHGPTKIRNMIYDEFGLNLTVGCISTYKAGLLKSRANDMPDDVFESLKAEGAYISDGFIYTSKGLLPHFLRPSLVKMTSYKGVAYITKYLVARLSDKMNVYRDGYIYHIDKDLRNTKEDNLMSISNKNGMFAQKKDEKEIRTICEVFTKNKGDIIKTWCELFDDYGYYISQSTLSVLRTKGWYPQISDEYFTKEDVDKWDNEEKYLKMLPLYPDKEIISSLPVEVSIQSETEVSKDPDAELFSILKLRTKAEKKRMVTADKYFLVKFAVNRLLKPKANGSIDLAKLQKVLKENSFDFSINYLKISVQRLRHSGDINND